MPANLKERPKDFKALKAQKFWMVNGQYSIEVSKRMKDLLGIEEKFEKFQ